MPGVSQSDPPVKKNAQLKKMPLDRSDLSAGPCGCSRPVLAAALQNAGRAVSFSHTPASVRAGERAAVFQLKSWSPCHEPCRKELRYPQKNGSHQKEPGSFSASVDQAKKQQESAQALFSAHQVEAMAHLNWPGPAECRPGAERPCSYLRLADALSVFSAFFLRSGGPSCLNDFLLQVGAAR